MQRDYNRLEFGSHSEIPWRHSTGKVLLKPTLKSLPKATPSSKDKYNENESTNPQIQLPHFFLLFEEFVLFFLLLFLSVGTGSCQMGFILKFKCFTLWQYCPLRHIQCQLLFLQIKCLAYS